MLQFKCFVFNPIQVNTWVIYESSGDCIIIDPGCSNESEKAELVSFITEEELSPLAVIATHGHFDHVPGVSFITQKYNVPFLGNKRDQELASYAPEQGSLFGFSFDAKPPAFGESLEDGTDFEKGSIKLKIFHVPGHSEGSIALYSSESKFVVVGDVLFLGSIGRTDLPGGNYETLISSIKNKLLVLPGDTTVLPGHGPETSIGHEAISNPFLV